MSDLRVEVRDNPARNRYEAGSGEDMAMVGYRRSGRRITFTHTEVPAQLRGQGVGEALARAVLERAREEGLEVVPLCPFIRAYIRRNPEFSELVAE